ncbi:MAG: SCO family protein [Xanthomonadaceae bacterium]|nr:SCO family protein [Xanthomonadaceae bacterium]
MNNTVGQTADRHARLAKQMGRGALIALLLMIAIGLSSSALANEAARAYFGDAVLIDQDGQKQRFYTDLLHDKVVLIHPFFTRCEGVCPVMAAHLAEIQKWLGDRLGSEVHLLSMSVDPGRDSVSELRQYSQRFKARQGWYLLTGESDQLDHALGRLGYQVEQPEQHTSVMVIGNVATGYWKKAHGAASASELIEILQSVMEDAGP